MANSEKVMIFSFTPLAIYLLLFIFRIPNDNKDFAPVVVIYGVLATVGAVIRTLLVYRKENAFLVMRQAIAGALLGTVTGFIFLSLDISEFKRQVAAFLCGLPVDLGYMAWRKWASKIVINQ